MNKVVSKPAVKKAVAPVFKPYEHQVESLQHSQRTPIVFDCSDPGTGKTFVRIMAAARRISAKQTRKVLILAPKTLLETVWAEDIKKFAPHLRVSVSGAGKHEKAFAIEANFYVTNIDAVKWLAKQPKKFFAEFDELVVDESTAYKHHTSQRSKAVSKIATYFKYRACLTGTPNSNSITDVWHQVKILDDGKRLGPTFYGFRNAVCVPEQVGNHPQAVRWRDKEGAEEVVFSLLQDIVIRHRLEDCTDLPANHQYTIPFRMEGKHRKAYDDMEQNSLLEIFGTPVERAKARLMNKKLQPKAHITGVHAAAVATKLLQIASGAVYETSDKYHLIDTARYEFVMDLVEQRKHSVVFFMWKHQRDLMLAEAKKRDISIAVIDGNTSQADRLNVVKMYQAGRYQTLLLHPQSAGHGITLTRGTTAVWPCPIANAEFFNQGSRRIYRISQKQKTETIIVVAQDSYEERVYNEILMPKNNRMATLLDLFTEAA